MPYRGRQCSRRLEARGISNEETRAISRAVSFKLFKLTEEGAREGGIESDFATSYAFALIIYMTVLLYGMAVQRSVIEDKTSRIVEILLSSAKPFQLMLGKILGVGGVGLTQYALWAIVALGGAAYIRGTSPALAGVTALAPLTLGFFVIYFVLGFLLYAAMYAAIGAIVTTDQEAQQMQWPVTMLIVIPIILMMQVLRDPDGTMSTVFSMIPFFSPIIMLVRINLHTPPAWQIRRPWASSSSRSWASPRSPGGSSASGSSCTASARRCRRSFGGCGRAETARVRRHRIRTLRAPGGTHLRAFGETVVCDPRGPEAAAGELGVRIVARPEAARARHVILCPPITRLRGCVRDLVPHLRPGTIVIDTCSVKVEPRRNPAGGTPSGIGCLATHPLFGPDSAAGGLAGHAIVICRFAGAGRASSGRFLERLGLRCW